MSRNNLHRAARVRIADHVAALGLAFCVLLSTACPGEKSTCTEGEWRCSEDALLLQTCQDGAWIETDCMRENGLLCENGQCVDPWRYGNPVWSRCPDEPQATPETLAEKAAAYDDIAVRLHVHPDLKWITNVDLFKQEVTCPVGHDPPCYEPLTPESQATWADVELWHTGENDGLWSALYLASQGFRYAVTGSADALQTIKLLLEGEVERMRITGVPGLFTRQLIPPNVAGIFCPADDQRYIPDPEKDDNMWVRIGTDGCVWVVDSQTLQWTATTHCGLEDFVDWCFLDNVSQDEYAGHMFALGVLARLVDDPEVQATITDLLEQVGLHLMNNDLTFVDWDGRGTEWGRLYPFAVGDTPGYTAVMAMNFILMTAEVTGRADLRDYYDNCLLQKAGPRDCLDWPLLSEAPFTDFLNLIDLYEGPDGCESNWDNISMLIANFHHLLWYERDPEVRALLQAAFDTEVIRADNVRAVIVQSNAWYNFMWAAHKRLGPGSDGPALDAVHDAICALKQFPASKHIPDLDPGQTYPHDCTSRHGGSLAAEPIPLAERCPATFTWWRNPYSRETCTLRTWSIRKPSDYLLPYWMGRYYGFIPEDL